MEKNQIYKCETCGNIVEILQVGGGDLVCCGNPMRLMVEKTTDPEISVEKHLPVIEKSANGIKVSVGSVIHPMEEGHYIEFIEVFTEDGRVGRKEFKPGDAPEADFPTRSKIIEVRALCNLHGLWKTTL